VFSRRGVEKSLDVTLSVLNVTFRVLYFCYGVHKAAAMLMQLLNTCFLADVEINAGHTGTLTKMKVSINKTL